MINIPFISEKRFLSIDFGSINIKIVEGIKKQNKIEIINFGIIPIINFKEIGSSSYILEENLALIINDFLKETKMKTRRSFFNITAPYLFSSSFLIPDVPEKSLPQIIRFESQKQVPLSFEEIEMEYRYLKITTQEGAKQWLIFLSAVPKIYLNKIKNISLLVKLNFSGYGMEYFNLEPYFLNKFGNFVIIDLGHSYSTIHLVNQGKIIYGNKLKLRGYDFLDNMMKITKFSEEQVIDLATKRGFLFNPEERELKFLADNFLKNIAQMIKNEIEKIENSFLLKIEKIYWTGGLCFLNGFKENILTELKEYQQEILNPANFVDGEKFKLLNEKSTIFSQSIGLLIRKLLS